MFPRACVLGVVARLEHDLANVEALKDLKLELRLQKEVRSIYGTCTVATCNRVFLM